MKKLRFVQGHGSPPIHVSSISNKTPWVGDFLFSNGFKFSFNSKQECLSIYKFLVTEKVPMSVGGHSLGPAEELSYLISVGELNFNFLEISWSSPKQWTVREIGKGAPPWEEIALVSELVNLSFNPESLKTYQGSL